MSSLQTTSPGAASPDGPTSPITAVSSSTDLWALVLRHVPLLDLPRCASTCRAHLSLKVELTRHITHLGMSIVQGSVDHIPLGDKTEYIDPLSTPYVCLLPGVARKSSAGTRVPPLYTDCLSIYNGLGRLWPMLPRVTAIMPNLTHLYIDLTPEAPDPWHTALIGERNRRSRRKSHDGVGALPNLPGRWATVLHEDKDKDEDGVRASDWNLNSTASCLSGHLPHPAFMHPQLSVEESPQYLLPARQLTHLAITVGAGWRNSRREQKEPAEWGFTTETAEKIASIFMSCAMGSQRTLRHLDLTGVGPAVLPYLVHLELLVLQLIRIGYAESPGQSRQSWEREWPANTLSMLAGSFPTLTDVDIGHAHVHHGVSFDEVDQLCRRCEGLRHLDLSMVMTYVDFTPCLLTLSNLAPRLVSLAIDGLFMETDALKAFGVGCPLLERVHFRHCCFRSPEGLIAFLRAARKLRVLDVSFAHWHDAGEEEEEEVMDVLNHWLDGAQILKSRLYTSMKALTFENILHLRISCRGRGRPVKRRTAATCVRHISRITCAARVNVHSTPFPNRIKTPGRHQMHLLARQVAGAEPHFDARSTTAHSMPQDVQLAWKDTLTAPEEKWARSVDIKCHIWSRSFKR
jgi:hypothetical protein